MGDICRDINYETSGFHDMRMMVKNFSWAHVLALMVLGCLAKMMIAEICSHHIII